MEGSLGVRTIERRRQIAIHAVDAGEVLERAFVYVVVENHGNRSSVLRWDLGALYTSSQEIRMRSASETPYLELREKWIDIENGALPHLYEIQGSSPIISGDDLFSSGQ